MNIKIAGIIILLLSFPLTLSAQDKKNSVFLYSPTQVDIVPDTVLNYCDLIKEQVTNKNYVAKSMFRNLNWILDSSAFDENDIPSKLKKSIARLEYNGHRSIYNPSYKENFTYLITPIATALWRDNEGFFPLQIFSQYICLAHIIVQDDQFWILVKYDTYIYNNSQNEIEIGNYARDIVETQYDNYKKDLVVYNCAMSILTSRPDNAKIIQFISDSNFGSFYLTNYDDLINLSEEQVTSSHAKPSNKKLLLIELSEQYRVLSPDLINGIETVKAKKRFEITKGVVMALHPWYRFDILPKNEIKFDE